MTSHSVWRDTIKIDPYQKQYIFNDDDKKKKKQLVNLNALVSRSTQQIVTCTKCGECNFNSAGHLSFQCFNQFCMNKISAPDGKTVLKAEDEEKQIEDKIKEIE